MNYALSNAFNTSTNKAAEEAALAPRALIDASLGQQEDSVRATGLILTKEQIIDLYRYEQKGLHLPTTAEAVSVYLGYDQQNPPGRGLAVSDFTKTFSIIKVHASQWDGLRQRIKLISSELKLFATFMNTTGKRVVRELDTVSASDALKDLGIITLEDLKRVEKEMGTALPDITLNDDDKDAVESVSYFLDRILARVDTEEKRSNRLKADLDAFSRELSNTVRPEISLRLVAIDNNNFKDDVIRLQKEIEDFDKQIDEKSASYKQMVNDSLSAASKLNVIGLGMAIYFGVEAEKVRKERNALKKQRNIKNTEMGTKSTVLRRLNDVKGDMQDLELLTLQADVATQNLVTVWNKLYLYIKTSQEESKRINDALKVRFLAYHFEQVIEPWALIKDEADDLYAVFAEADAEIKKYR
ncbi:alpha-xenorhabdolysin family binary toxin subunit A [Pseudomonas sp. W5-36]|uniref:alpha-xenorhabdolysin family binary toxin subunit A n=1 Tax=Pseudomonas sp. W5-36 TaxID=3097455 RepID=UPI003979E704